MVKYQKKLCRTLLLDRGIAALIVWNNGQLRAAINSELSAFERELVELSTEARYHMLSLSPNQFRVYVLMRTMEWIDV